MKKDILEMKIEILKTISILSKRIEMFKLQLKNSDKLPLWFVKDLQKKVLVYKSMIGEQKEKLGIIESRYNENNTSK
ncbi:hypothetical protein [Ruminococcus sp.]|uniref:hypothetical protein n=1 Tax=Ruminococcus sp. TaxID=41978 RepID=UPI002E81AB07|nr:hypothetical protein [Ruminococcus sp.]MEE3440384.1 hypothetical protein [Ruminococcus sp.]